MEKIPTAYNWLKKQEKNESGVYDEMTILHAMMTFAKLHVEACKKDILNNVEIDDYDIHGQYSPSVNEDSILNSYPLDKIK